MGSVKIVALSEVMPDGSVMSRAWLVAEDEYSVIGDILSDRNPDDVALAANAKACIAGEAVHTADIWRRKDDGGEG